LVAALLLGSTGEGARGGALFPSGTILFSSSPFASLASEKEGDLFAVQADGTGLVNLTQHPAVYRDPVWSPDGREVAFQSNRDGRWRLYRMTSDAATVTPLPGAGPLDFLAGWSPDGLSLLLVTLSEVNREVVLLGLADGARTNPMARDPAEDGSPVWFPDGRAILFVSDRVDRTPQLFRLDLATGAQSQLTDLYRGAADPIVSPDGRLVACATERDALSNMDLCVMSSDGTSPRTI
jgi:TolB protein